MAERESKQNIVLFPFMAHGHLNPFMSLAKLLERRKGYKITIVNTPLNIQKLKSSLPSKTNIQLAEIPFNGTDYGLPPDTENTDTLSFEFFIRLFEASENLESAFKNLILNIEEKEGRFPVCIISDMFLAWTVKVANKLGIFHSVFIAGSGYSMGIYFSLSLNINQYFGTEEEFSLLDFPEVSKLHKSLLGNDLKYITDATMPLFRFRERQFLFCLSSDAILLNSMEELEQIGAKYFSRKMGGKPVWMIGPACSTSIAKKDENEPEDKVNKRVPSNIDGLFAWLDVHTPRSVLYVSFGSQNAISASQMKELAIGLEASGVAFIWVIRPPIGFKVTEFKDEWLPDGFEDRVKKSNQGILVRQWAPQVEILSHKSTGAFLSHCGWNSVLESLSNGVPIIGWPLAGDQFFNSYLLEKEVGVCLEVARGIETAVIQRDHVARTINLVISKTNEGEKMRKKVHEIQKKMKDAILEKEDFKGSSAKAMDEFLRTAIWAKKKHSVSSQQVFNGIAI